jgi:L,D-peptidoglycan transpeptidase YkuD (ErfK/YbiS/YcfS/YnhG family)
MSKNAYIFFPLIILAPIVFAPLGIAGAAPSLLGARQEIPPGNLINSLEKRIGKSSQVLIVRNTTPAAIDVRIVCLERQNGGWQYPFAPLDGVIGRKGFASPGGKREGDGRTPAGIFALGTIFGYAPSVSTRMPYRQATVDDLWVDDVRAEDYNRWVKRGTTQAKSYERMRRDDDLYKYGIVVEYNTNPVMKGQGSAIFFHLWQGRSLPTAGCIALSEADLLKIIKWLDPEARPLVVLGTQAMIGDF